MVLACGQQQRATWLLCCASPHWGEGENGKKKAKLVGQHTGSLTEVNCDNNNTDKENIQNKQQNAQSNSHHPMPHALSSCDRLHPSQLPCPEPSMTARGIFTLFCLASLDQLPRLCSLLASGEN